jgi:RHS repeat-associated protein
MGFKPWGELRFGTSPTQYQFTGQYRDSYINLYWYGSRWFDPALGRWIQPDAIVPEAIQGIQAWDRFAYSNNSPVVYNDPMGHSIELPCFFCDKTWINYSSISGEVNTTIDIVATVGCFVLGCHVDRENDVISGPTYEEYAQTSIMSLGPAPLAVTTGSNAIRIFGGGTADTIRGRAAHLNYRYALGSGYKYEQTLPSGLRPDAIDWENHIIRELKPDNSSAIQSGWTQVRKYLNELFEMTGKTWTAYVDTYKK